MTQTFNYHGLTFFSRWQTIRLFLIAVWKGMDDPVRAALPWMAEPTMARARWRTARPSAPTDLTARFTATGFSLGLRGLVGPSSSTHSPSSASRQRRRPSSGHARFLRAMSSQLTSKTNRYSKVASLYTLIWSWLCFLFLHSHNSRETDSVMCKFWNCELHVWVAYEKPSCVTLLSREILLLYCHRH